MPKQRSSDPATLVGPKLDLLRKERIFSVTGGTAPPGEPWTGLGLYQPHDVLCRIALLPVMNRFPADADGAARLGDVA